MQPTRTCVSCVHYSLTEHPQKGTQYHKCLAGVAVRTNFVTGVSERVEADCYDKNKDGLCPDYVSSGKLVPPPRSR